MSMSHIASLTMCCKFQLIIYNVLQYYLVNSFCSVRNSSFMSTPIHITAVPLATSISFFMKFSFIKIFLALGSYTHIKQWSIQCISNKILYFYIENNHYLGTYLRYFMSITKYVLSMPPLFPTSQC